MSSQPLVKICGVRTVEAAVTATEAGADIIGMIFAPSPRLIDIPTGQAIAQAVKQISGDSSNTITISDIHDGIQENATAAEFFAACGDKIRKSRKGPLLAGVFQNQPLDDILAVVEQVPLDLVQLHGTEPIDLAKEIPVPVIKVFHVDDGFSVEDSDLFKTFRHSIVLLDTKVAGTSQQGGRGVSFDWTIARRLADSGLPFIMAGGLTPDNVKEAVDVGRPWGVDVSSGTETNKVKDPAKIAAFVANARQ